MFDEKFNNNQSRHNLILQITAALYLQNKVVF